MCRKVAVCVAPVSSYLNGLYLTEIIPVTSTVPAASKAAGSSAPQSDRSESASKLGNIKMCNIARCSNGNNLDVKSRALSSSCELVFQFAINQSAL
jgi:hypothetical protein